MSDLLRWPVPQAQPPAQPGSRVVTVEVAEAGPISYDAALETDESLGLLVTVGYGAGLETDAAISLAFLLSYAVTLETDSSLVISIFVESEAAVYRPPLVARVRT